MEKKKALLVVAGGRGLPDFLALFCVRPHLTVIITSEEGWDEGDLFKDAVRSLPYFEELLPTQHVPSYDMEMTKAACMRICQSYPQDGWEWTFSIGSCPKMMGIGAYEAAKEMNRPCIYMDAQHEKVASLVRPLDSIPPNIFHLTVDDYLRIYGREVDIPQAKKTYRDLVEEWGYIGKIMAHSLVGPVFVQQAKQRIGNLMQFSSVSSELSQLLKNLEDCGAIKSKRRGNRVEYAFVSEDYASFLSGGTWLEVYVWSEAKNRGFADDCQWGYIIRDTFHSVPTGKGQSPNNELDGLFMYKTQLILVECKTGKGTFKGENHHLDIMNDKSDMLGRSYVTKIFVTNENKAQNSYADFAKRAEARKIVVIAADELPNVGQIIEQEAKNPRYKRK